MYFFKRCFHDRRFVREGARSFRHVGVNEADDSFLKFRWANYAAPRRRLSFAVDFVMSLPQRRRGGIGRRAGLKI